MPYTKSTALVGLVPRTEGAALGGLSLTSTDFHVFRTYRPPLRIDGLSAPPGRFVTRVSASVATTEGWTGRRTISPAPDTDFASVFAVPTEGGTGPAEALAAAATVAQQTPLSRSSTQETDSAATIGPTVSAPASLGTPAPPLAKPPSDCISIQTRPRMATATGNTPPAVDYDFGPGGGPRPSARRANTPPRVSRPRPTPSTVAIPAPTASPSPRHRFRLTATAQSLLGLLYYDSRSLLPTRQVHLLN